MNASISVGSALPTATGAVVLAALQARPYPDIDLTAFYEPQRLVKWRTLMEDGRKIGHTYSNSDLVIAATALQHGLTVVTRDRSDFEKAQVPVFNPWNFPHVS